MVLPCLMAAARKGAAGWGVMTMRDHDRLAGLVNMPRRRRRNPFDMGMRAQLMLAMIVQGYEI